MSAKFDEYNELFFENKLPKPKVFGVSPKCFPMAFCHYRQRGKKTDAYKISLSKAYRWDKKLFQDVFVHEMIHIYELNFEEASSMQKHGKTFRHKAKELNTKFHLNITPRIPLKTFLTHLKPEFRSKLSWYEKVLMKLWRIK